jgi:ABC-type dipeptide/oligopeptide/nickel transport system permease subunit
MEVSFAIIAMVIAALLGAWLGLKEGRIPKKQEAACSEDLEPIWNPGMILLIIALAYAIGPILWIMGRMQGATKFFSWTRHLTRKNTVAFVLAAIVIPPFIVCCLVGVAWNNSWPYEGLNLQASDEPRWWNDFAVTVTLYEAAFAGLVIGIVNVWL